MSDFIMERYFARLAIIFLSVMINTVNTDYD